MAILAVLIFHVSPASLTGGFTGVDVFFVLSGFLITSQLLVDISSGVGSMREFYLRRIQRLLPNLIATVLVTILLWTALFPESSARLTVHHGVWTLFNLSNCFVWQQLGGYWGNSAEWAPLTHTWSLGVEEQFYLLFPTALLLLRRWQPNRTKAWLIAATVASFALSVYGSTHFPVPTFYLLPTRLWELLIGAVLAAHRVASAGGDNPGARTPPLAALAWPGLGLIMAGFFLIDERSVFPGWVSLLPTLGALLLLAAVAEGGTALSRALSNRWMVRVGKLSYSLYLWHWPLITLGKILADQHGYPRLAGTLAGAGAGIVVGGLAYAGIEQPLRRRTPGRGARLAIIAASFAVVAAGAGFLAARGPVEVAARRFDAPTFSGLLFNTGVQLHVDLSRLPNYHDVTFPPLPARPDHLWRSGGIIHSYGGGQPKIVVLGSSHALMYSRLIDDLCRERGISVAFLAIDGGVPAFFVDPPNFDFLNAAESIEFNDTRRKYLREWRPAAVFVIDRWDAQTGSVQKFTVQLRAFLSDVGPVAGRVYLVTQVPAHRGGEGVNLRDKVVAAMGKGTELPPSLPDAQEGLRQQIAEAAEAMAADYKNLSVLRADLPFYTADGFIRYAEGRNFFYADNNHLSDVGSNVVRPLFQQAIAGVEQAGQHGGIEKR